jgi:Gas vesicle protein K
VTSRKGGPKKSRRRRPASHRRHVRKKPNVRTKKTAITTGRPALRWNPDTDDVQRSVVQLVLTLVELVRKLMERQAIRRMEQRTLTRAETEAVGAALMEIERTIRDIGKMFDLTPEDLNLDLGVLKLL